MDDIAEIFVPRSEVKSFEKLLDKLGLKDISGTL